MPHTHVNRRKPAMVALGLVALLLVSLGLAACGSSSSSSPSTKATTSASTGTGARGAGRFAAVQECLEKEGITLPKRTPGEKRPPGGAGGFLGGGATGGAGGPKLPAGVTRAKYEAALKKCGGGFARGGAARFDSPTFKAALAKFATCMRQNGVNVPAPNTSGSGPVFDTKGIDTSSAQFKAAEAKCQSDLSGAFKHGTGAGGAPGTNGAPAGAAPPSSGEAPGGAAGPPAG
jgi:cytochrome c556